MSEQTSQHEFPAALLNWSGHRAGGVRRLFHDASGRPCGSVIETPLLLRLKRWAKDLVEQRPAVPRIVLLVGGPGNGKTEAVESTVVLLDELLGLRGALKTALESQFNSRDGNPVPRLAQASLTLLSKGAFNKDISIVQDASVTHSASASQSPASLLVKDLEEFVGDSMAGIYLACVNRGVLDDALIDAIDNERAAAKEILETIIRSVALSPTAPECWPLLGYPDVAVWPMDVETLVASPAGSAHSSPASQLIEAATREDRWPVFESCPAGEMCPYCHSRALLAKEGPRESLLHILRWYELATGKRWSFRDLFSLVSYLLAGVHP